MIEKENLFSSIPATLEEELVETLASGKGEFKIERIVSRGHSSPAGFWYEQEAAEWVVVVSGYGEVQFEQPEHVISLGPGDWIEIPAGKRHRVRATSDLEDTIWIAVHWNAKTQ